MKKYIFLCFFIIATSRAFAQNKPSIQPKWFDYFSNALKNNKENEIIGYGLLSTGGWVDNGQYFLIKLQAKSLFYYVKPAATTIDAIYEISQKKYSDQINGFTQLEQMDNYHIQALDGLEYEFFVIKKSPQGILVTKQISITQPDLKEDGLKYKKAIDHFFELNKLLAAKEKNISIEKGNQK